MPYPLLNPQNPLEERWASFLAELPGVIVQILSNYPDGLEEKELYNKVFDAFSPTGEASKMYDPTIWNSRTNGWEQRARVLDQAVDLLRNQRILVRHYIGYRPFMRVNPYYTPDLNEPRTQSERYRADNYRTNLDGGQYINDRLPPDQSHKIQLDPDAVRLLIIEASSLSDQDRKPSRAVINAVKAYKTTSHLSGRIKLEHDKLARGGSFTDLDLRNLHDLLATASHFSRLGDNAPAKQSWLALGGQVANDWIQGILTKMRNNNEHVRAALITTKPMVEQEESNFSPSGSTGINATDPNTMLDALLPPDSLLPASRLLARSIRDGLNLKRIKFRLPLPIAL